MTNVLKYSGIDLPYYGAETSIAWTRRDMEDIADAGELSMVRRAVIYCTNRAPWEGKLRYPSLPRLLEAADKVFSTVCAALGAQAVRHVWGLAKLPDANPDPDPSSLDYNESLWHPLLPAGHALVAEVDVIQQAATPMIRDWHSIRSSLRRLKNGPSTIVWDDGRPQQFVDGIAPHTALEGRWLIDIDPQLAFTPSHFAESE